MKDCSGLPVLSKLYMMGLRTHRRISRRQALRLGPGVQGQILKTVAVGNVVAGGTGKTPLVELLARECSKRGNTPMILSRGYGQDERYQYALNCPENTIVGIGSNRVRAAEQASQKVEDSGIDLKKTFAILDDAFQTWHVERDEDIVCVNCINPWSNGKLIPHGKLREPLNALTRATRIVLYNTNMVSSVEEMKIKEEIESVFEAGERIPKFCKANMVPSYFLAVEDGDERMKSVTLQEPDKIEMGALVFRKSSIEASDHLVYERNILPVSGIENPQAFHRSLVDLGGLLPSEFWDVPPQFSFPDHHYFTSKDMGEIKQVALKGNSRVVMTQKDACRVLFGDRSFALEFFRALDPCILVSEMQLEDYGETEGAQLWLDDLFRSC